MQKNCVAVLPHQLMYHFKHRDGSSSGKVCGAFRAFCVHTVLVLEEVGGSITSRSMWMLVC